jgi:dolichol-phosphate mannosyltransferase
MTMNAQSLALPSVSVIVPTYQEVDNIPLLVDRIAQVREEHNLDLELLIMDDDSGDGTEEVVDGLGKSWVRLVVRKDNRGLSPAVVDGMRLAKNDVLVCMDADLSHPPEVIPDLLEALTQDYDFAIGSRYVEEGSTDESWSFFRRLNSRVATLLALPLTRVKDPLSGFFALRRELFESAHALNPIGYKIGLELIVKTGSEFIKEVPIHFSERKLGESKLTFAEQVRYLQHLKRLFIYSYGNGAYLLLFVLVAVLGAVVNLTVLTALHVLRIPLPFAVGFAVPAGTLVSLALNRRITFSYVVEKPVLQQLLGFVGAGVVGGVLNFAVNMFLINQWIGFEGVPQLAALAGIVAEMMVDFGMLRFVAFREPARRCATK